MKRACSAYLVHTIAVHIEELHVRVEFDSMETHFKGFFEYSGRVGLSRKDRGCTCELRVRVAQAGHVGVQKTGNPRFVRVMQTHDPGYSARNQEIYNFR